MAEAGASAARPFLSGLKRGDRGPSELKKWFVANGPALVMLFLIFVLALFVRSYFGYEMSSQNGYIVSGGSDSYYWQRIIGYSAETGKQLYWDPLINYPDGIRNPRPPFFSMSIVVPAVFSQGLFDSLDDALGWTLIWSTAFWGALTVVPTYFLGKEVFGRRAGLVAAFFLALMPSHVQRSVLSEADHDSFILFFIVLTFYFLLRAVKAQQHRKWVESWRSWPSIRAGFKEYFANSRTSVLYALMGGTAFGSVIMAWVGFGYVAVLILAYYLIQVIFNKLRNIDSMSVTVLVFISMGFGYLISFPVYYEQSLIPVRFDVPVYLFLASIVFGFLFVISRDYPWTMTFPAIGVMLVIGVLVIDIISPALAEAILSGQGYFVKSKLYSTIAEARAPRFSELAMGFGMVTFFLSLIGLIWAFVKIPKQQSADYIFIVVWLGAAIFMAISAGRFMFNAAPAFALAAAWVLVMIVDRLDFNGVRRSLAGASGSYFQVFRKSVKVRHIVGALFLAFMVVLPNVWYGTDAGIPSERKSELDKEIYFGLPSILRPSSYDEFNGSNWYLGAFGYSLPLPSYYFPAAWSWFADYDADILPVVDRPAYVSWWDYGFEAVQAGQHPTVADNFQNGYQLAGNIIMSQSETEAIALFAFKLINTAMGEGDDLKGKVFDLLDRYGVSSSRMNDILGGPGQPIIDQVLADPATYGPMAQDLSDANARIVAGRVELVKLGLDKLVTLYGELCALTGWDIRYFSVDSRMFPRSGTDTGIFYAPAKLSDRRIEDISTPVDFYEIKAVDQYGRELDFDQITPDTVITSYTINYKDMFYDSMFYRAMVGFSGSDIGLSNDGIPGLSGSVAQQSSAPGWNLTHFKMVYRTAYYNPYPSTELAEHRDAWRAISLEEARDLKLGIEDGSATGYVDDSTASYYTAGAVFLKYYAGAYVNGTVTTQEGHPVANIRATVVDEFSIPHQTTLTDADGHYSLLAPFGNVEIILSTGDALNTRLTGENVVAQIQFNVTDDQAMRMPYDLDNDGLFDYIITKDYVMEGTDFDGDIYWDLDLDGNYSASEDELIPGVTVFATEQGTGQTLVIDAADGTFGLQLPPGTYDFYAEVNGRNLTVSTDVNVTAGAKSQQRFGIKPATLTGTVSTVDGKPAEGIELVLTENTYGQPVTVTTGTEGNFTFERLMEGQYTLTTTEPGKMLFEVSMAISEGGTVDTELTLSEESSLRCTILREGLPVPYAAYVIFDNYDPLTTYSGTADSAGVVDIKMPKGSWTLYSDYFNGVAHYVGAIPMDTLVTGSAQGVLGLQLASTVTGSVKGQNMLPIASEFVTFEFANGARVSIKATIQAEFELRLPPGTYTVTSSSLSKKSLYSGLLTLGTEAKNLQVRMDSGVLVEGVLWAEKDESSGLNPEDQGARAKMSMLTPEGARFTTTASANGSFVMVFPDNVQVTLGLGDSGYAGWSQPALFAEDTNGLGVIASPDEVAVTGQLTFEGAGVRGVDVSFYPVTFLGDVVTVTTGAGGYYTALVEPSEYSVVVSDDTTPMGGERYSFTDDVTVLPSGQPLTFDIATVKKVQMHGVLLGAATDLGMKLDGPEALEFDLDTLNYSMYILPGSYRVYATGTYGGDSYANISIVEVSLVSREYDFQLRRAQTLSGTVMVGSAHATKLVTVTATSSTGEVVETASTGLGAYSIELPTGSYTVNFLLEETDEVEGRVVYVEYYFDESVTIGSSAVTLDPELSTRLDNSTFSGTTLGIAGLPAQATIQLVANSRYGLGTEFSTGASGAFSVQVQPGDYTMYVTRLVDKSAYLSSVHISRNVPLDTTIELSEGRYLTGLASIDGTGFSADISLQAGDARLDFVADATGFFGTLVPSQNYSLTSSTTRVENTVSVLYSASSRFYVGETDVYVDLEFTRDTRHAVAASWSRSLTQTALPGVTVQYAFTVENKGNVDDTFLVTFTGTGFDVTFTPSQLNLSFGINNKTTVIAEVTAQSSLPAGDTAVSCLVRSKILSSARTDLSLYLNIAPQNGVLVKSMNKSDAVSSLSTLTKFYVNNTGNVEDEIYFELANKDILQSLGWNATIVEPITLIQSSKVKLDVGGSGEYAVMFTAIRADPDPNAIAYVLARSSTTASVSHYGSVPVMLPELVLGPGDVDAVRGDISYEYDATRLYVNIGLLVALASLMAGFFIMRRKKGLGGGAKK